MGMSGVRVRVSHRPLGVGPALARKWPVPVRRRLGIAVTGALFCAAVVVCVVWRGLSWDWAAVTLGATYALVIWLSYRTMVRAGEGWLAKGRNYVRTDRLTALRAEKTLTGVRFRMGDADSRHLHLRPSDISGNPDVRQLARAGVLASRSVGLDVDAPTSHYFALLRVAGVVTEPVPDGDTAANQELWTRANAEYTSKHAYRAWAASEIAWGVFNVPERRSVVLGDVSGLDVVELGCRTAYFSVWLARRGARPVAVDITAAQLATARQCQDHFGIPFPLVEADAGDVPLPGGRFDLVISECGASLWCDRPSGSPRQSGCCAQAAC